MPVNKKHLVGVGSFTDQQYAAAIGVIIQRLSGQQCQASPTNIRDHLERSQGDLYDLAYRTDDEKLKNWWEACQKMVYATRIK